MEASPGLRNRIIIMKRKKEFLKNWQGSCLSAETTLHQISPYIGKMKSAMARTLIYKYTKPRETILDPFVGSGTIALEALIAKRKIIASDINPYALTLTRAKLNAPSSLKVALKKVNNHLELAKTNGGSISLREVPSWVKSFYHPRTLKEILKLCQVLKKKRDYFTMACLLGILHHQRPGFLSFPASHLVPYLRTRKFPKNRFNEMYNYREVSPRLIAKIKRTYKRFPIFDNKNVKSCVKKSADKLQLRRNSIDVIITSPPYMNALDYARDNRLRMWFLGCDKFQRYDKTTNNMVKFVDLMDKSLRLFHRTLKKNGKCILVIGQVRKSKNHVNVAKIVIDLAVNKIKGFKCLEKIEDFIPDIRRARRYAQGSKKEWIVVLKRV